MMPTVFGLILLKKNATLTMHALMCTVYSPIKAWACIYLTRGKTVVTRPLLETGVYSQGIDIIQLISITTVTSSV